MRLSSEWDAYAGTCPLRPLLGSATTEVDQTPYDSAAAHRKQVAQL